MELSTRLDQTIESHKERAKLQQIKINQQQFFTRLIHSRITVKGLHQKTIAQLKNN